MATANFEMVGGILVAIIYARQIKNLKLDF